MRYFKVLLCLGLIAFFSNAYSQSAASSAPPSAAINACSDKGEGDACDFMNNNGSNINGICHNTNVNGEGKLVCVANE